MPGPKVLLTAHEAAEQLRVPLEKVVEWIRGGELQALSYGHRHGHRIRLSDLEQFIASRVAGKAE